MPGGAPLGNQNGVKAKRWQQAIDRALEMRSRRDGIEALDKLAAQFLDAVETGAKDFMPGFRELGDRMDGRPQQDTTVGNPDGSPLKGLIFDFGTGSAARTELAGVAEGKVPPKA